jgi:hypothetical protein
LFGNVRGMEITYVRIPDSTDGVSSAHVHLLANRDGTTTLCGAAVEAGATLLWTGDPATKTHAGLLAEDVHAECEEIYRTQA